MSSRYIVCTLPGYLALIKSDAEFGKPVLLAGQSVVALPENAFWALIKTPQPHHNPSVYADMVTENPERMARVEANGIGPLRCEKQCLLNAGLSRAAAHQISPLPGTYVED